MSNDGEGCRVHNMFLVLENVFFEDECQLKYVSDKNAGITGSDCSWFLLLDCTKHWFQSGRFEGGHS